MTKVVHINEESYDVYIGRPSVWGNPFTPIKDRKTLAKHVVKNTKEALDKFRVHVLSTPELYDALDELKDKTLGCFCRDQSKCHGGVLIKLLEEKYRTKSLF